MAELIHLQQRGLVDDDEFTLLKEKHESDDRKLTLIFNAFKTTQDRDDFIHSIKRFCKRQKAVPLKVNTDPFTLEVESIGRVGKFSALVVAFCKE